MCMISAQTTKQTSSSYSLSDSKSPRLSVAPSRKEISKARPSDLCSRCNIFPHVKTSTATLSSELTTVTPYEGRVWISTHWRMSICQKETKQAVRKALVGFVLQCDFFRFPWKQFGVWHLMLSKYIVVFVAFWERTCNHHSLFNAPQWNLTVAINHNSSYSIHIDFGGIRT